MNEIHILNKHTMPKLTGAWPFSARRIYIGRGSPLGNPYPINDQQNRDQVIALYETWLYEQLHNEAFTVTNEMLRLARLVQDTSGQPLELVCFCAPQRCHGEIIRQVIHQALGVQPT